MNRQEEILKQALEKITPDVWDSIARDINDEIRNVSDAPEKLNNMTGSEPDVTLTIIDGGRSDISEISPREASGRSGRKRAPWYMRLAGAAAALVVFAGGIWGFNGYKVAHTIDSLISLDVNPSIELAINSKDRVIGVDARNEDAIKIIGDMDLEGSDIDVALNALLGSLMRNGYIDEARNSILLSVDNKDQAKGEALRQRLLDEISAILESDGIEGAVLSRTSWDEDDDEIEELAEQYNISEAKAQLIRDIVSSNSRYSFEDLTDLTINELNLLTESPNVELEHIQTSGKASDKEYIGRDKAVSIALEAAGVKESDARELESEMDYEGGVMVYEVEFETAEGEYEFDINALTGEIVKNETESKNSSSAGKSDGGNAQGYDLDDDDDDDNDIDDDDDDDNDIDDDDDDDDDDDKDDDDDDDKDDKN